VYLITSEFFILIFFSLLLLLVEIAACGYFAGVDLRESRCGGFRTQATTVISSIDISVLGKID
jgi:hypothetical protein